MSADAARLLRGVTEREFRCRECGATFVRWCGQCPRCDKFGTIIRTLAMQPPSDQPGDFYAAPRVPVAPIPYTPGTHENAPITPLAGEAGSNTLRGLERETAPPVRITDVADDDLERTPTGIEPLDRVLGGGLVPAGIYVIGGEAGCGKCLGRGTGVIMYDGRIAPVESIRAGDLLMGADGKIRNVLSTTHGEDELFRIDPVKGEPWVCNSAHVMTLVHSITDEIFDLPLSRLSTLQPNFRRYSKLFTARVDEFAGHISELPIDPYFLGLWFGDGTKELRNGQLASVQLTKPDREIKEACESIAREWGLVVTTLETRSCPRHSIVGDGDRGTPNQLTLMMRALLGPELRMPACYTRAPRTQRLQFLAGLIDSDGDLASGCFSVTQKREDWAREIWWMARSLGLRSIMAPKRGAYKRADGTRFEGDYWRVSISGDTDVIPTRIARKQAPARRQIKDATRTGFVVEPIGRGEYFGFTLDGDGRFLLGDFTVTHNSTLVAQLVASIGLRCLYVTGEETIEKATLRARRVDATHPEIWIVASNDVDETIAHARSLAPAVLVVDSIQTLACADIGGIPGSVSQVKECGARLAAYANDANVIVFMIGHVTKDGELAGPNTLKHLVDVVLSLEGGEEFTASRILRSSKNRFGSTAEIGVFQMTSDGLTWDESDKTDGETSEPDGAAIATDESSAP